MSFKRVEWRLSGEWHIDYILIDDINVTNLYSGSIGAPIRDGKIEFKLDDSMDDKKSKIYHRFNASPQDRTYTEYFELVNKKSDLSFYHAGISSIDTSLAKTLKHLYHAPGAKWKIKMLYKKNLRIELLADDKHYEIYFRKKNKY